MLRLQLLGGFGAHVDGGELTSLAKQPRRAALLAYLAVERRVARSRVIALLWPDVEAERGRHSLNQAIYYLRRTIGADWIELRGDECIVAPWVGTDVEELERAAGAGDHERVLQLYQGPLLAGMPLADTVDFDLWLDRRRAAIDRMHRRARRQRLAALLAAGRTADALQCAEEWCRLDPLEDEAQHRYMELLASAGQRGAALRQFSVYQRLLDEYELKPLDETIALVEQLQHGELAPLRTIAPAVIGAAREPQPDATDVQIGGVASTTPVARTPPRRLLRLLQSRRGLAALLGGVFIFNLLETTIETWLAARIPVIDALRLQLARASYALEGHISFEHHELTNRLAVIGYSTAYFMIFPALLVAVGVALARRAEIRPFRVFALGVAANYAISLPFFLFYPVPERWYYPDSGAMVLSDLWSVYWIELFRPISGLDNSFPSVHVSLTVLVVLLCFVFRLRFRWSVLCLGGVVVPATLVLGIHWLTDLIAGAAVGVLSLYVALRLDRRLAAATAAQPGSGPARPPTATQAARDDTARRAARAIELEPR